MLFNSIEFVFFFIIVTTLYFSLPHKFRWFLLLASSCYFYMAFVPLYILILAFTIVVDYFAGILIERNEGRRRRMYLILSLIANVGVLAVFKYYNFLNDNLSFLCESFGVVNNIPYLSILLPIGLSFHTFQAMSYTIEVYRGNQPAERHFGIYSLYVMFYPQLVAGPIERPQNLLSQFRARHKFDYERVTDGLKLMMWGLFKKVVIADRLAIVSDEVFNNPVSYEGLGLAVGVLAFTFQIFCDFSGYSDIAIGCAQVMGIKLMTNFKRPYFAQSISEFWSRWHISLSTWFRDYLYIPLGGNRVAVPRWYLNLFIVFLVSGLWHGANWTYIIWGALHGGFLVFAIVSKPFRNKLASLVGLDLFPKLSKGLNIMTTFLLASFAWIFFRANTVNDAFLMVENLFVGWGNIFSAEYVAQTVQSLNVSYVSLLVSILAVLFMEAVHYYQETKGSWRMTLKRQPVYVRWGVYYTVIFVIISLGVFDDRQFIYFQF